MNLYFLFIGGIYIFEEQLNHIFRFNIVGAVILMIATIVLYNIREYYTGTYFIYKVALLLTITIWSVIAFMSPSGCGVTSKGIISMLLLWVIIVTSINRRIIAIVTISKEMNVLLSMLLFFLILDAFGINLFYSLKNNSGPFSEPSHLAFYILPIITYRILSSPKDKVAWFTIAFCSFFSPSTTLLAGIIGLLAIFYIKSITFRSSWLMAFFISLIAISFYFEIIEIPDTSQKIAALFTAREAESANHTNLTSLVWMNGWSQAIQTLKATSGLGLGFNQMGCGQYSEIGDYSALIAIAMDGVVINAEDGSFLASKLIAELGILGIGIVGVISIYCIAAIRAVSTLKRLDTNVDRDLKLIRASGALLLLILLFIRSGPYFQLPVLLGFSLLTLPAFPNQSLAVMFATKVRKYNDSKAINNHLNIKR